MLIKASVFNEIRHQVSKAHFAGEEQFVFPQSKIITAANQVAFCKGSWAQFPFLKERADQGFPSVTEPLSFVHTAIQDIACGRLDLSSFMMVGIQGVFIDLKAVINHNHLLSHLKSHLELYPKLPRNKAKYPNVWCQRTLKPIIERDLILLCTTKEGVRQAQKIWERYLPKMREPFFLMLSSDRHLPIGVLQKDPPHNYKNQNRQVLLAVNTGNSIKH